MALVESADAGLRAAGLGAGLLRLRAPGRSLRAQEAEAARLVKESGLPVIVTSRVDLALAVGAAGVHLVEGDLAPAEARSLAPDLLLGRSVHSIEGAVAAEADYLLFGPIWPTPTHSAGRAVGLDALRAVAVAVAPVPVLAVGGVETARTERVMRSGAAGWAAIRMYAGD